MPKISAPIAAPIAEPNPPVSRQPPITAAMMNWNSSPMPWLACTVVNRRMLIDPTSHAASAVPRPADRPRARRRPANREDPVAELRPHQQPRGDRGEAEPPHDGDLERR